MIGVFEYIVQCYQTAVTPSYYSYSVFIYKIITRDTVEEKILVLQERKRHLVNQVISTEGGFFKSLTTEDIQVLFS